MIYIKNLFLNFGKTVFLLLKEYFPSRCHSQTILEEPDEINESIAINLQSLPSWAWRKTATAEIFRKYLKEVKDLSFLVENEDTLGEALGYLTNVRILWQMLLPKEVVFPLSKSRV